MSVNKVYLLGNLGADPEVKTLDSGLSVANVNLATNSSWTDAAGEKQQKTEWHSLVAYGPLAETMGKYLKKGRQVLVEGSLTTRSWEDKDTGQTRYKVEVKAHRMEFLGEAKPKTEADGNYKADVPSDPDPATVRNYAPGADNSGVDEIPF